MWSFRGLIMKDYLNQEINIGDRVVCTDNKYNEFIVAYIVKITAKMVMLSIVQAASCRLDCGGIIKRFPYQVIKINK